MIAMMKSSKTMVIIKLLIILFAISLLAIIIRDLYLFFTPGINIYIINNSNKDIYGTTLILHETGLNPKVKLINSEPIRKRSIIHWKAESIRNMDLILSERKQNREFQYIIAYYIEPGSRGSIHVLFNSSGEFKKCNGDVALHGFGYHKKHSISRRDLQKSSIQDMVKWNSRNENIGRYIDIENIGNKKIRKKLGEKN